MTYDMRIKISILVAHFYFYSLPQQHKADAPFSYQGQPGMVLGGLNGCNRVCPRLKALPYELLLE